MSMQAETTDELPVKWRRVSLFLAVGFLYALLSRLPLPGIDIVALTFAPSGLDQGTVSRVSVLALGIMPLFTAIGYVEIVSVIAAWRSGRAFDDSRGRHVRALVASVIAFALTGLQGYALASALVSSGFITTNPTTFTITTLACFFGATALLVVLSARMTLPGLGSGFWMLWLFPHLLAMPGSFTGLADWSAPRQTGQFELPLIVVFSLLAIVAIVAVAKLWRASIRQSIDLTTERRAETMSILIWPPFLASLVVGHLLMLMALLSPDTVSFMQPYLPWLAPALIAIVTPLFVAAYQKRWSGNGNAREIRRAATWIAVAQVALILSSAILNAFLDLPMTGIVLLVATVATLSMLNFNTPRSSSGDLVREAQGGF